MDSIRLSQINEALNYDKNINSMVFNLEKKRVAMSPDPIVVPYSQVNAEALTAARAALDQLRVLLDSKRASLSLMIRPGSRVLSQEFAHGASDVGQVELVGQLYNQVVGLYSIGNLTQQTKGLILQSIQQIQKPVAGMIAGLRKVLEELSKVYSDTNNPSLGPTATFYFVQCIEALACLLRRHLRADQLNKHRAHDRRHPQAANLGPDQQEEELAAHCWTEERGQALQGL